MAKTRRFLGAMIRRLVVVGVLALFLIALEFGLKALKVPSFLIPLPSQVWLMIKNNFGYFFAHTSVTMLEAVLGFVIGNVVAYGLALIFVRFPAVEKMGLASAVAVKATPVVVLAPLFIIWFGNGIFGKCLMSGLICFFPMLINSVVGLRAVEPDVLDYLRSLGASNTQILRTVRIPSSLPYVIAAAKSSSTIAVVGAVIAELSGADRGIGSIFLRAIWELRTDKMFAAIAFVAVGGILFYALVSLPGRYLARRGFDTMANVT
jgi:NitT/TauT family transport system permease protein